MPTCPKMDIEVIRPESLSRIRETPVIRKCKAIIFVAVVAADAQALAFRNYRLTRFQSYVRSEKLRKLLQLGGDPDPELLEAERESLIAKIKEDPSLKTRSDPDDFLCRVTNAEGKLDFDSGAPFHSPCFMCKKYRRTLPSSFACILCETPVCGKDRGRGSSCLFEHLNSTDTALCCNGHKKMKFPHDKRIPYSELPNDSKAMRSRTPKPKSTTKSSATACAYFATRAER